MAEVTTNRRVTKGVIGAGISAGLLGGVVMGLFAMIVAALTGPGFWAPMKLISAVFLGQGAMTGGAGAILLGMIIHLFTAAVYGVIFAALISRRVSSAAAIALGGLYGIALFLFMTYLVLPWANPVMFANINQGWFFLYHVAYGLTVGIAAPARRKIEGRTEGRVLVEQR